MEVHKAGLSGRTLYMWTYKKLIITNTKSKCPFYTISYAILVLHVVYNSITFQLYHK